MQVIPPEGDLEGVFISNYRSANNEAKFRYVDIGAVLCMMKVNEKDYKPLKFLAKSKEKAHEAKVKIFDVNDTEVSDMSRYFFEAAKYLHEWRKEENVLVQCEGDELSRSTAIIIAYLLIYYKLTYEEALERIRTEYRFATPNFGFKMQLISLQKLLAIDFKKFEGEI